MKRLSLLYLAAFAIGIIAGHGDLYMMPASLLFPCLFLASKTRSEAAAIPLGYYGAYLISMFPGAALFFQQDFNAVQTAFLWLVCTALSALPWLLCNHNPKRLLWAVPCAIVLSTIPPLGLMSVGNPILATGVILPSSSWIGVILVLFGSGVIAANPKFSIPAIVILTYVSPLYHRDPAPPAGWTALNTNLGGEGARRTSADSIREYTTLQFIQRVATTTTSTVTIFPESITRWNRTQDLFLQPVLTSLAAKHRIIVVGATSFVAGQPDAYSNLAAVRGSQTADYYQRVPIPVTMWHPLSPETGVKLNITGPATTIIAGRRAALYICYEQLLPMPMLLSAYEKPSVIVGMANDYWARGTYFPSIQSSDVKAIGRLFAIPTLIAVNQ